MTFFKVLLVQEALEVKAKVKAKPVA